MFSKEMKKLEEVEYNPQPGVLSSSKSSTMVGEAPLAAVENEAIQIFTNVARVLGYPRSVGEIFGILFAAEQPTTFAGIGRNRGTSAGTVSVGQHLLRELGVIVVIPIDGDRRDHFTVNDDFRRAHAALIQRHIEPPISAARIRIDRVKIRADKLFPRGNRHLAKFAAICGVAEPVVESHGVRP
jgi:DNA-binding transcriptional regulator GbsR (MarR family)